MSESDTYSQQHDPQSSDPQSSNPQLSDPKFIHLHPSDIQAIAQLLVQSTRGVITIAEGVHRSVGDSLGLPGGKEPGRAGGLTGHIYGNVRRVTELVGAGIDQALAGLLAQFGTERFPPEKSAPTQLNTRQLNSNQGSIEPSPQRDATLAILNGVIGDLLAANGNGFATPMQMRYRGWVLNRQTLSTVPGLSGRVLLMLHGLCMNDRQWETQQAGQTQNHGEKLAATLDYTPLYLRYNSGLHISQNGQKLAALLEELTAHWPVPVDEISVLAHSMGGLVIRSAIHYGRAAGYAWAKQIKRIIFLGTPHHGAPLEQAGNWVDVLLGLSPYSAPFAALGQIRSAGITDLRYGYLLDDDWRERDRFHPRPDESRVVPLPQDVDCFAMGATTASTATHPSNRVIGDGLVLLPSALGDHPDPARRLHFSPDAQWTAYQTNHLALLSSPAVGQKIHEWMSGNG